MITILENGTASSKNLAMLEARFGSGQKKKIARKNLTNNIQLFFLFCVEILYNTAADDSRSFDIFLMSFSCYLLTVFISPLSEPRKVQPIFKTDEPVCPEGKLQCGNGECIEKELFCNGKEECKDGSDENACSKYR